MNGELLADQPLGQKLIKKGFWLYFFAYLTAPAVYFIKVIISNSVSVADVGILYSIVGLIGLLNVYNDLGLTESLQYFLPRYWIKKQYDYIKTALYLSLFAQISTAIMIAIFLRLGAPRLAQNYFQSVNAEIILRYFCFYFLGINLFQILQSIFVSFQDTFNYQFVEFIKNRSVVGFTFFFFISGRGSIEGYSINRILGLIIGLIMAIFIFIKKYKTLLFQGKVVCNKTMLKEYSKYALRCFFGLNISTIFVQISQQMVIVILGAKEAGYFTNLISLFTITGVIIGPIITIIFPLVSELITKNRIKTLSRLLNFLYTYITIFSLNLGMFFVVLGPEIALVFFGQKFIFSGQLLSYIAIFNILTTLIGLNFAILAGMGKIKERVNIMLIGTFVHVILNIILIATLGIYGVLVSMVISWCILFILSYIKILKKIRIHIDVKLILKNIVILIALGAIIWLTKSHVFVLNDLGRYRNLLILIFYFIIFFMLFGLFNYKKIFILKHEIKKLYIT